MRIQVGTVLAVTVLVCGPAQAQNKLGDVAGSITLNADAVVEKEGYAEDPDAIRMEESQILESVLADCWTSANNLVTLVEEARVSDLYYDDDDLPGRLSNAALDLETQVRELELLRLGEDFEVPVSTARDAAGACAAAGESVRAELAQFGVRFIDALAESSECRLGLANATAQLEVVRRGGEVDTTGAGASPEPSVPTDEERVEAICEPLRARGEDDYLRCTDLQFRAIAALSSRTPANEMLPDGVFADLRSACAELHPADFALRDQCEVDRMTSTRLESE